MGLGPPVCQRCQVIAHYTEERRWHCRYCGEKNPTASAGMDARQWKQFDQNEKFYKFMEGKNPNGID